MIKLNKKGFTLIELLSTIFIIGVVMAISIVGITSYIKNADEKKVLITKTNVLSSAQDYVKEFYNESDWFKVEDADDDSQYSCVSIEQLKGKGYLDKNVNDQNYTFIILKRDVNTKVINYKNFASDNEDVICDKKFIITPTTPLSTKTYTNHITTEYKISSNLYDADNESGENILVREMEITSVKLNGQELDNYEKIITIENGDNNLFSKITFDFDSLIHNTEYEMEVTIRYKTSEENYKDVIIEDKIKTWELKAPTIKVENENIWKENKKVNIKIDKNNIYEDNLENSFLYLYNDQPISELNLDENESLFKCSSSTNYEDCNEELNNLGILSSNLYKFDIFDSSYDFTAINNDTSVKIAFTDGTNRVYSEKLISKIDNHNYICRINQDSFDESTKTAVASLIVEDTTSPKNNINKDIVTNYKWGEERYKKFNGDNNIIDTKTVKQFGKYNASVKLRTGKEISCSGDITDGTTPVINIEVSKNETVLNDTNTKWYSGTLVAKIFTPTKNSIVKYCKTSGTNGSCTPDTTNNINSETITLTSSGIHKIIAKAEYTANDGTKNSSTNYTVIIKIDNTPPSVPTSKVKKLDGGTDVTSEFKKNSWKKYAVTWSDYNSTDSHSGINKYQYIKASSSGSCDAGTPTDLNKPYTYRNKNSAFCIRAIDNTGKEGDWSEPYYFYVDTTPPKITINAYKRSSSEGKEGNAVASVNDVSSGNINSYTNTISGWLNKTNYPYGVYYDISYSDNYGLSKRQWKYNATNLLEGSSGVSDLNSGSSKNISGTSGTHDVSFSGNGYRKGQYIVTDQAGNTATVDITVPIDRTLPTLNLKIYKRKQGNGKANDEVLIETVANNSDGTKSIDKTEIPNNVNGWLNKANYPNGIIFEADYSDNLMLSSKLWEANATSLESNSDNVSTYIKNSTNSGALQTKEGTSTINFYNEGYRKARYTVTDIAGNKAVVSVVIPIDRTSPNPWNIDLSSKTQAGYSSLVLKSDGDPLIYEGKKKTSGSLQTTDTSCKDKNFETGNYTINIGVSNQYIIWDISKTSSDFKNTNVDTSHSSYSKVTIGDKKWVQYDIYTNNAGVNNRSFSGDNSTAKKGEKVDYWRICKDRAGNYSKMTNIKIEVDG